MWLGWVLMACVVVRESGPRGDSGMAECVDDGDCGVDARCLDDGCEPVCRRDEDCPGSFACGSVGASNADPLGCVERCSSDWDCKAGAFCLADGSCG